MLRSLQIAQLFVREPALQRHLGGIPDDKLFAGQDTSTTVLKNSALCSSLQVTSEVSDEEKPGITFCELL